VVRRPTSRAVPVCSRCVSASCVTTASITTRRPRTGIRIPHRSISRCPRHCP